MPSRPASLFSGNGLGCGRLHIAHAAADARLLHALQARGFVESLAGASSASADVGLVRSVLAAGFYPQVCLHLTGP